MGGKSGTTTQQVQIPPEVLARYTAVNQTAEQAAQTPFQQYGGQFVAPLTDTQQQGISQAQQYSQSAQPYYQAGAGLTAAGSQGVGALTPEQIQQYQNPYTQAVVDPTLKALQLQQGQQMSSLVNPQTVNAFGGDRSGLVAANLARQQELGTAQAIAPLYQQGYTNAVQTATQQQGVEAQNLARQLQAGAQFGQLGAGAQGAGLSGAQAVIGAGTLGQQTQQAQDTAQYQQFLQERGYPFQVAQFLAGIAEGTGAQSGSTTTTTSPTSFFSDVRLKDNIEEVGRLHDGQKIYRYDMGDGKTQLGLLAQDVLRHKPEAVGLHPSGFLTVDYHDATDEAAGHGKGLIPNSMGGAVSEPGRYADGGSISLGDLSSILAMQHQFQNPQGGAGASAGPVAARGYVPQSSGQSGGRPMTPGGMPAPQKPGFNQGLDVANQITGLYKSGKEFGTDVGLIGSKSATAATPQSIGDATKDILSKPAEWAQGWDISRASGGSVNPYSLSSDPLGEAVQEGEQNKPKMMTPGAAPQQQPGLGADILHAGMAAKGLYDVGSMAAGAPAAISSAASTIGSAASGVGSFLSEAAPFMLALLKDGGTADRGRFAAGGTPDSTDDTPPPLTINKPPTASSTAPTAVDPIVDKLLAGTGRFESGNDYKAVGPVTAKGDRAYGIHQIMGANIPSWTKEVLGQAMTPQQFLENPDAQNAVGRAKMGQFYKKYGTPEDAASVWFTGKPVAQAKGVGPDILGTTPNQYVNTVMQYAGLKSPQGEPSQYRAPTASATAPPSRGLPSMDELANRFMAPGGTGAPQQAPDQGGVSGLVGSEKFWIPLLSGLGQMASSPSRYLGSAILQGLGGGAQAYASLEQQQAQRGLEQQRVGIDQTRAGVEAMKFFQDRYKPISDRLGNVTGYRDTTSGQDISVNDYQAAMANAQSKLFAGTALDTRKGIAPPAPAVPGTTPPVTPPTDGSTVAEKPAPATEANTPSDPRSILDNLNYNNISDVTKARSTLRDIAAKSSTTNPEVARQASEQADKLDEFIKAPAAARQKALAEGSADAFNKYRDSAQTRAEGYAQTQNSIDSLASIYSQFRGGRGTDWKAALSSWASSLGLPVQTQNLINQASNFDAAMKIATKTVIDDLATAKLTRAPAASIQALQKIVADPTIEPGALYEILGTTKGLLEYGKMRDEAFMDQAQKGEHPIDFLDKFNNEHKDLLNQKVAESLQQIPYPKDIPSASIRRLNDRYGKFGFDPEAKLTNTPAAPTTPTPARAVLNGRTIEVRGGKWVFSDTGEEAK